MTGNTTTTYDYETVPGSGEVAGLIPSSGGATLAPLHDIFGSTLGLVGSANTLQTQWSYEPFGAPTLTGTPSSFPFLFDGGQYDPTGYYGDYSPRLQHSLSGGSTPYSGGGSQPGVESHARASGGGGGGGVSAWQWYNDSSRVLNDLYYGFSLNDGRLEIHPTNIISDLINLFEDIFGGGSPSLPPPRAIDLAASHRPECNHIGVSGGLCADQSAPRPNCPPVPPGPPPHVLHRNIQLAKRHPHLWYLIPRVSNGGKWDYRPSYDNFGNFNYGATFAAAGFSRGATLRCGGAYHAYFGTPNPNNQGSPFGDFPYGNTPEKEQQIANGYDYYSRGCDDQ